MYSCFFMWTFLRVIRARILYRIPLKFLLILLSIWTVLFVSFSSADYLNWLEFITNVTQSTSNSVYSTTLRQLWFTSSNWIVCFFINSFGWNNNLMLTFATTSNIRYRTAWTFHLKMFWCFDYNWELDTIMYVVNKNAWWVAFNLDFYFLPTDNINIISWSPFYSSMQCQTEYNLIPIEEVDKAYCESNNLCPAWWTPSDCPNVWVSNLFINDIFHPWAFNVIMNIPSEIDWDYAYTNSWNNINIDVVWYNQDEEYINAWIDTNNYKPTTSDFTNIFNGFSKFGGLLVATLFVIFVFYLVKKVF